MSLIIGLTKTLLSCLDDEKFVHNAVETFKPFAKTILVQSLTEIAKRDLETKKKKSKGTKKP